MNTLYYGDNLHILRDEIASESVDLIYLDPPFNSNRNYNVLFKEKSGSESPAQIEAFTDTWTWDQAAVEAYQDIQLNAPNNVATLIEAMRQFVGSNDMMAYLVMMTQRLVELHRVLKPTGSLYLHCDPTASHYLKMLLDTIFGVKNFRNEIIWKRTGTKGDAVKKFGAVHDSILLYSKSDNYVMNPQFAEQDQAYLQRYRLNDNDGRGPYRLGPLDSPNPRPNLTYEFKGYQPPAKGWRVSRAVMEQLDAEGRLAFPRTLDGRIARKLFLSEQEGPKISDVWSDISPLQASQAERLGYPTQKPLALLERIIEASSNTGDVVLDPFCGCGTAVVAAQKLGREWIGIDITHLAVALMRNRLVDAFGETLKFEVKGLPADVGAARMLAEKDRYEFQYWANSLVNAQPVEAGKDGKGKKGADGGVDGIIRFIDDESEKVKRVIVSVKSGHVSVKDLKDLRVTRDNQKAELSLLVTLEPPTKPMLQEALLDGQYESVGWGRTYPRCQIITIEQLLNGQEPNLPPMQAAFKRAQGIRKASEHQAKVLPGLE